MLSGLFLICFFFSSRRRHTRFDCDWSSDVCSSDLEQRVRVRRPGVGEDDPEVAARGPGTEPPPEQEQPEHREQVERDRGRVSGGQERKSVVEGKRGDLGGRRIIKKKKKKKKAYAAS